MGKYKGFTSVELKRPGRSNFDLSHEKRISGRIGRLIPVLITETMPNDTFYGSTEVLLKLATLIAPIYHRLNLYVHYFFVPNRLLWEDWEPFITGGRLGEQVTTPPVPPRVGVSDLLDLNGQYLNVGSISDYLGFPPIADAASATWTDRTIDLMPHAAVYKVWDDYYRDRNYVPDDPESGFAALPLPSGLSPASSVTHLFYKRYRCWEHDYFTSAMLTTQRGAEVLLPLQGTGSVTYTDISNVYKSSGADALGALAAGVVGLLQDAGPDPARIENIDEVFIENSSVSINDVRRANRLQEWLERNQLAGSRYNESIMAHFGRRTSDSRLQRPEYLGGGKAVVQISEVMTTAFSEDASSEVVPPGNPAGRGSTYADTNKFSYNCEEHGFVVGMLSVLPTSGYMQGIPKMFQDRNTFLDYPWPTFAHLGEQEVWDSEIFVDPTTFLPDRNAREPFGYQSRYSDWKQIQSSSHGDFRTTLDYWHLTRKFSTLPILGANFVTVDDELQDRVFNVSSVDTLWMYVYNKLNVKRSLPYFGTPQM